MIGKPCPLGIISYVKRLYSPKRYPPSFDEIIGEIFIPLSELLPSTTYVVDGLDECELEEVRKVLKTFQKMISQHGPRVFISGREDLDVTNAIPGSVAIRISNEDNKEDIRRFIEWRIEEKMRERQLTEKESVLQEIKSKLNERADHMLVHYFLITFKFVHILIFEEDFMGESTTRGSMGRVLYRCRHPKGSRKPTQGSKRDLRPVLNENKHSTYFLRPKDSAMGVCCDQAIQNRPAKGGTCD